MLLLGDFNIDLQQYNIVPAFSNFLDLMGSLVTSHSSTLIDNIFASPEINLNEVLSLEDQDTEAFFNSFFTSISNLIDKHVPLIKSTRKQRNLNIKTWVTQGLLTSMKIRDKFFKDFHKSTEPELKVYLHGKYKFYRNRIVSLRRLSKKLYFNDFLISNSKK